MKWDSGDNLTSAGTVKKPSIRVCTCVKGSCGNIKVKIVVKVFKKCGLSKAKYFFPLPNLGF